MPLPTGFPRLNFSRMKAPNVVCLIADDTDPNNLGCYGADQFLTPNLDRLAAEGMRFTRANAVSPVCTPSRYAYLTGQYPSRCPNQFREAQPLDDIATITWNTDLAPGQTNLASIFRESGYTTGYVGKFHCGRGPVEIGMKPVNTKTTFDAACRHDPYDPVHDATHRHNQECIRNELQRYGWEHVRNATWGNLDGNRFHDVPHNLEWTTRGALDFLQQQAGEEKPFLLYVGYHTIHGPKHGEDLTSLDPRVTPGGLLSEPDPAGHPPRSEVLARLRRAGLDTYHRNVGALWMDDSVGVILERLRELGLEENTIVIFKADHGKFAKATVYQAGSQVPMIWRWPGRVEPGSICRTFVQNIDFLPTLIDALHLQVPAGYAMDGCTYLPNLHGSTEPLREDHYNEMGCARSVQTDRWKYVSLRFPKSALDTLRAGTCEFPPNHLARFPSSGGDLTAYYQTAYYDADQLYEIQQDRGENINLAGHPDYAEVLTEMKARLRRHLDTLPHLFPEEPDPAQTDPRYREAVNRSRRPHPSMLDRSSVFGFRFW